MAAASAADVITRIWLVPLVREIVNPLVLLLAAGAFVLLLWGIIKFIRGAGDDAARKEGRDTILWGIVGLVVIFGAYGIINSALTAFNLPTIHPISTLAQNGVGGGASSCATAGAKTGSGGTAADMSSIIAGSATVEANTGANSCAALDKNDGNTWKEIALNQCSCSDTSGVVCCGEFPAISGQTIQILPTPAGAGLCESTPAASAEPPPSGCADTVTSQTTWQGGIAALKTLMQDCPVEVTAKFGEYGFDPAAWYDFNTGNAAGVEVPTASTESIIQNPGQYLTPNGKPIPDYGLIHIVHTHPQAIGEPYLPPSGVDIINSCGQLAKLLSISAVYGNRFEYDVVAPDGLYTFNCLNFAQTYAQSFTPTQNPWSSTDTSAFISLAAGIDIAILGAYPLADNLGYQNTYLGPMNQSSATCFDPSTATDAQKQEAVAGLLQLYQALGVTVTKQSW